MKLAVASSPVLAAIQRESVIEPQRWIDGLVEAAAKRGTQLLARDVARLLAALDGAGSFEDARARVLHAYRGMLPPKALGLMTASALRLAHLAGRASQRRAKELQTGSAAHEPEEPSQ